MPPASEREATTRGWIKIPLVIDAVAADFGLERTALTMALSDVMQPRSPVRFFTSQGWGASPSPSQPPAHQAQLELYGRRWQLEVQALFGFGRQLHQGSPAAVAALGGSASVLLGERANMAAVIKTSRDAIVTHDIEGRIVSWNPAAERILGWRADEAIGRNFFDFVPPAQNRAHARGLQAQLQAGHDVLLFEVPTAARFQRPVRYHADTSLSREPRTQEPKQPQHAAEVRREDLRPVVPGSGREVGWTAEMVQRARVGEWVSGTACAWRSMRWGGCPVTPTTGVRHCLCSTSPQSSERANCSATASAEPWDELA